MKGRGGRGRVVLVVLLHFELDALSDAQRRTASPERPGDAGIEGGKLKPDTNATTSRSTGAGREPPDDLQTVASLLSLWFTSLYTA